ncbi:MAG TPA: hypothetical protein VJ804_10445 [Acidimicrobiales bacterium]|nr:hypothetical protein [Acidimicrobiales bacterium]
MEGLGAERGIELDGELADVEALAVLDDLAAAASVAFLVEMDHCIHERHEFRLLCIRYLASRGWRWFGEELDWRMGQRIDRYLASGDTALLEPVDDGNWYRSGVLAGTTADPALTAAMNDERKRFAESLRRTAPNVRYFGFDVGGGDAEYLAAANAAATFEDLLPVMAMREELMHRRVDQIIDANPGDKVALMAGSTHLMKDDRRVSAPGMTPAGGGSVPSIGHHVAHTRGAPVLSIWQLHGGGHSASPWLAPTGELVVPEDTINASLAKRWSQPCLALVAPSGPRLRVAQMNNLVLECALDDQADAIIFHPEVTPVRQSASRSASLASQRDPARSHRAPLRRLQ